MLCIAIAEKGLDNILESIKDAEMAEIRIEKTRLTLNEVSKLFSSHNNLLATCRPEGKSDAERLLLLKTAIDAGAKWVDIEIESSEDFTKELVAYAKSKACKVIISYHNYDLTPDTAELNSIVADSIKQGAEIVKLACKVNKPKDNARLICLYNNDIPVVSLGMGELGMITRIAALKMGAPFTFARGNNIKETAPGQLSENEMNDILSYL